MNKFDSLTLRLEGRFEAPLGDLPEALRKRIIDECPLIPWDHLTAEQRRAGLLQHDYKLDPATEKEREALWGLTLRKRELLGRIDEWEAVATPTATDLSRRESMLEELRLELETIERREQLNFSDYNPATGIAISGQSLPHGSEPHVEYVAFPKAMKQLADRFSASADELAVWVWLGEGSGGLVAYLNANELDPPPRFYYDMGSEGDFDYRTPLMACWFKKGDITRFRPKERFITGTALIERWSEYSDVIPDAFIQAKVAETRLQDIHPITGVTQGTDPGNEVYPSLKNGLYSLSEIVAIEAEDLGVGEDTRVRKPSGHLNHDPELQARANEIAQELLVVGRRDVKRSTVAKILALEVDIDAGTVERRIRKQW